MNAPLSKLSFNDFGMKANRLLLPIDLAKCPPEIFPLANGFVKPVGGEIVLLHVVDPQARSAGRDDSELRQARRHLERLGHEHLRHAVEACFRIRTGIPHEEICAEAAAANVDLILLPTFAQSLWGRLLGNDHGTTGRNVVVGASRRIFVISVRKHFNCFRRWAGEESSDRWAA